MLSKTDPINLDREPHVHKLFQNKVFDTDILSRPHTSRRSRSATHRLLGTRLSGARKQRSSLQSYYQSEPQSHRENIWRLCERPTPLAARDKFHSPTLPNRPGSYVDWFQIIAKESARRTLPRTRKTKDFNVRLEFARSIGLAEPPTQSDASFDQLYGLFDNLMRSDSEHDSVESVKRLRRA